LSRIVIEYERHKPACALATIVKVTGSSYRGVGARMLITADGRYFGLISPGCLEKEVVHLAQSVIETGTPLLLPFDLRSRFGCDGEILVFVENLGPKSAFIANLDTVWKNRKPITVATRFRTEKLGLGTRLVDDPGATCFDDFVEIIQPPIRLVIFGEKFDTEPLANLGVYLGWQVTVENEVHNLTKGDNRAACVIMSHQFGRDLAAMKQILSEGFGYVGLIGSRRRRQELVRLLLEEGCDLDFLRNVRGPAGLDIGSESMEEISLAIIAEVQASISGRNAAPLRDRRTTIHHSGECLLRHASR
jgi:xanthine dehydrogenase accessory factor